ncbi:hypothetical protein HFD88_004959 [Aspergillus terreus]|nr:hypothetical protein HFD88_004959 [Aspergillus terreus]
MSKSGQARGADTHGKSLTPLGHAVRAQLWAAHHLLAFNDNETEDPSLEVGLEVEEDLNETVTRIIEARDEMSVGTRKEWLKQLQTEMATLMDSARVQALLKIWTHAKRQWPNEIVIIFSSFLSFLDIIAAVLEREHNVVCLRCFRQGQEKEVKVFKLFATNSAIDTEMLQCQSTKAKTNMQVMGPLVRRDDEDLVIPDLID